jgi:hypothetical protein
VLPQGSEVRGNVWEDELFKHARHVVVFQASESKKICLLEPKFHGRSMRLLLVLISKQGRIGNSIVGTTVMCAYEEEDIKNRLQIMDNTMWNTKQKQFNCDERWSAL